MFEKATNFEELFKLLREKKEVVRSDGSVQSADDLIDLIEDTREIVEELQKSGFVIAGNEDEIKSDLNKTPDFCKKIRCITRTEDLRGKVFTLVINEITARGINEKSDDTTAA